MTTRTISNSDDLIDSRAIIERIAELEGERDYYEDDDNNPQNATDGLPPNKKWAEEYPEDAAELTALLALQEEAEGYSEDWKYGATLVRDSYFTEYAMELLEDVGDLPRGLPSYIVIDEEATARNIQQDYTQVDYDGIVYWIR